MVANPRGGGCRTIGSLNQPQAEYGKPEGLINEYRVIELDGATIYLERMLDEQTAAAYRLHVTRFMGHKNLEVSYEGE